MLALLAACGPILPATYTAEDLPALDSLDTEWGCGTGFWVGDAAQTVTIRFSYVGEGKPDRVTTLPHPDWQVHLIEGTDLYANWCDDVVEEGEPVAVEHWNLEIVEGRLVLDADPPERFGGGPLTMEAIDLVVALPDGTPQALGSISVTNSMWGFFAG